MTHLGYAGEYTEVSVVHTGMYCVRPLPVGILAHGEAVTALSMLFQNYHRVQDGSAGVITRVEVGCGPGLPPLIPLAV